MSVFKMENVCLVDWYLRDRSCLVGPGMETLAFNRRTDVSAALFPPLKCPSLAETASIS